MTSLDYYVGKWFHMLVDNLEKLKLRPERLWYIFIYIYICFQIMVQTIQYGLPESRPHLWVGAILQPDLQMTSGKCKIICKLVNTSNVTDDYTFFCKASMVKAPEDYVHEEQMGGPPPFSGIVNFCCLFDVNGIIWVWGQIPCRKLHYEPQSNSISLRLRSSTLFTNKSGRFSRNDNRYGRIITTHSLNTLLWDVTKLQLQNMHKQLYKLSVNYFATSAASLYDWMTYWSGTRYYGLVIIRSVFDKYAYSFVFFVAEIPGRQSISKCIWIILITWRKVVLRVVLILGYEISLYLLLSLTMSSSAIWCFFNWNWNWWCKERESPTQCSSAAH